MNVPPSAAFQPVPPDGTPLAEMFHPAAPSRRRPHRGRDLAMLGLALIVVAAAATQFLRPAATPATEALR